jgi:hypothetical protein
MSQRTLILKGSGGAGLGDKLWAVVVGIMYARLTERVLVVDWRDTTYGDGTKNYFPDLFSLSEIEHILDLPEAGSVIPEAWRGRLQNSLDEVVIGDRFAWSRAGGRARYSFDQSRLNYDEDHLVMWDMDQFPDVKAHFVQRFQEHRELSDEQIQAIVFQRHLKPCEDVVVRASTFQKDHFVSGNMIGVHVRKTQESDANRPNPEVEQFIRETGRLLKAERQRKVFLACDNRAVIELFETRFGSARVYVFPKWMPAAGMHMHMNPECPDQLQSVRDAMVDAMLLGRCDWLISSRSSAFSWLGRMFSAIPEACKTTLSPTIPWQCRLRNFLRSRMPSSLISLLKNRQGVNP